MEARRSVDLSPSGRSRQPGIKRRFRLAWFLWIPAGLLMWAALSQTNFPAIWEVLRRLRGGQVVVLLALNLSVISLFAVRWWLGLVAFKQRVSLPILVAYRLAGFGISYFTPGPQVGGEPLQIHLLIKRDHLPAATALASVFLDRLVDLLANFTFLIVGLVVIGLGGIQAEMIGKWSWLAAVAVLGFPVGNLWLLTKNRRPLTGAVHWLNSRLTAGWVRRMAQPVADMENQIAAMLKERPWVFMQMVGISGLTWMVSIGEFALLLRFLGLHGGVLQILAIMTMARLAFLLPFPAGLGVLEAGLVMGVQLAGFNPAAGLAAALIIRARDMTLGGIGLWLGSWLAR